MTKVRPHFRLKEFVPPNIYDEFGGKSIWFLDQRMLDLAEFYRTFFDAPVTVNTWHRGGNMSLRGYRPPMTNTGATFSQHKFGRAFDCTIEGYSPDEVRQTIFEHEQVFMDKGLTTLESGQKAPTWVHSDIRHTTQDTIKVV